MGKKKGKSNWIIFTRTVILWVSGKGWPSLGLTTWYFPTVMELLFISSVMHLVWPNSRSNWIDSTRFHSNNPDIRPIKRLCNFISVLLIKGISFFFSYMARDFGIIIARILGKRFAGDYYEIIWNTVIEGTNELQEKRNVE